jgi:hypothetical protein
MSMLSPSSSAPGAVEADRLGDTNPGTRQKLYRTLRQAIDMATVKQVYACEGLFEEAVAVPSGGHGLRRSDQDHRPALAPYPRRGAVPRVVARRVGGAAAPDVRRRCASVSDVCSARLGPGPQARAP